MRQQGPILVPLDGSETAEGALPYASALATALRTHLVLLTVWEGTESELGANFPSMAVEIQQAADAHFGQYLDGIRQRLHGADQIRTIVRSGDASDTILDVAEETGARAIAIATHGRSGIGRWLYGSTASSILHRSPIPVLAIGPNSLRRNAETASIAHIMLPLDGSELSERAIPVAKDIAAAVKAKLSLVRVVRWAVQAYPYSLPDAYVPQVDQELEAGAKAYLRRQEEALKGEVDVDAFVVRGAVADGLLDFVDQKKVDLTIMTTRARTGIARAALGSTADRMLQGNAPVLLIPPEAVS
ncbi:MAG TPA: universal stress protein [Dehalococcoidia bacterium]|nr:universal stress protein [Dehalococcoidia bacterium]